MSEAEVVICTHCGSETPLQQAHRTGVCAACDKEISPDAPTRIRTERVEEQWDKLHGDDYEPSGGVDFSRDEISEPDRDITSITEALTSVETGDKVEVTLGTAEAHSTAVFLVVSHDRTVGGFDHRINFIEQPREDGWTRMYITTIGDDEFDPWEVVSSPYDTTTGTVDMRDFASNGWLIDAEPTEKDPTPVARNPDRDVDDRRPGDSTGGK